MIVKVEPISKKPLSLLHAEKVKGQTKYYYKADEYPYMILICQGHLFESLIGKKAVLSINENEVDSEAVCSKFKLVPEEWHGAKLVAATLAIKPEMVGNVTPLTNIWKLKKFRKPFDLTKARETLSLNQTEMANMMEVNRHVWLKWERGERKISAASLKLVKVLLWLKRNNLLGKCIEETAHR